MARSFSVVIPTFDRRVTALLAVRSALAQTRPPLEVLVVCDGCTDDTVAAVAALADPRARALDLPKAAGRGYANRTRAIEQARGDVIAYLADDDLWLPDHLERHGALHDADLADIVSSMAALVHPDDSLEVLGWDWRQERHRALFMDPRNNRNPMSSVSHDRRRGLDVGGWPDVPVAGDAALWRALLRAGARPSLVIEPTVVHFRATGRAQAYEERVAQNGGWWESICDPDRLAALRARLSLELTGLLIAEEAAHAETERQRAALNAQAIAQTATIARLQGEIDALQQQLQTLRAGA
jgi:glycosyltransferase involved in cell wall biosynthesis